MNSKIPFAVGCFTDGGSILPDVAGKGITLCSLDASTGRVEVESVYSGIVNPSYLEKGESGILYAISECFTSEGGVWAFDVKGEALTPLWTVSSRGRSTCHVCATPGGVAATSYGDAKLMLLDRSGGFLDLISYEGSGPVAGRQESSHPHQAVVSPGARWLLVPDLGSDCVWGHRIDQDAVEHAPSVRSNLPPGTGPRHLLFHRGASWIAVLGELDGSLHTGDWNEADGVVEWRCRVDSTPGASPGLAHASAIRQHPVHPMIYTANRSRHEIVAFSMDEPSLPVRSDAFPAGGNQPRDFAISPDGNWLVTACQGSHLLGVHRLSLANGLPDGSLATTFPLGSPSSILFL